MPGMYGNVLGLLKRGGGELAIVLSCQSRFRRVVVFSVPWYLLSVRFSFFFYFSLFPLLSRMALRGTRAQLAAAAAAPQPAVACGPVGRAPAPAVAAPAMAAPAPPAAAPPAAPLAAAPLAAAPLAAAPLAPPAPAATTHQL